MTNKIILINALIIISSVLTSNKIYCQDKLELGIFLGGNYYLGDLNPSQQFKNTRPAIGGIARYIFSDRLALKGNAIIAGIAGDYPSSGDVYLHDEGYTNTVIDDSGNRITQTNREYSFDRTLTDVGLTCEINFRSYDHIFRKTQTRFTPYLTIGLASTIYRRYKSNSERETVFVLSLPFGFGAKYKVNKWLRVGVEWTWRKTFADDLDVVEVDESKINPSDPYGLGKSTWTHNNDWYSLFGINVTCSMWPRKLSCNDGINKNFNRR